MNTGIHITSEIGPLRKVVLHRPGKELENLMPDYLERLLFDDIPYLQEAQREHDAFADCLRQCGAEVVYLTDLVVQSLTDETIRQELLEQFLDKSTEDRFLDREYRKCAKFYNDAAVMLDEFEKESGLYEYPFIPLWDEASEILILGSFPSVKSRETGFFYGHPQNRFWKMLAGVFEDEVPLDIEQKKEFLHRHHIALWDVIASCEITGSSDSSIRKAVPTDLSIILDNADIRKVYINGRTAEKYYKKYTAKTKDIPAQALPSTSPANAAWSLPRLIEAWSIIRQISPSSEEARF